MIEQITHQTHAKLVSTYSKFKAFRMWPKKLPMNSEEKFDRPFQKWEEYDSINTQRRGEWTKIKLTPPSK